MAPISGDEFGSGMGAPGAGERQAGRTARGHWGAESGGGRQNLLGNRRGIPGGFDAPANCGSVGSAINQPRTRTC